MSLQAPAPSGKRLSGLAPKGKGNALAPGAPPSFGGGMGSLNPALAPSFASANPLGGSSITNSSSSNLLSNKPSAAKLAPVLPSLNLQQKKIDTSILDRDDYFGSQKDSQWGIPTKKPTAPETLSALPSVGSARTPRSLPTMDKKPNTSLLDAQRPTLALVPTGSQDAVVDYNLLLNKNPLKPAFQGLGQQGAFDSALTARR